MKKNSLLFCLFLLLFTSVYAQGPAARQEAKIDEVYAKYALSGEGVLTVMMDRGIDYRHPDFIDAEGNTRIAYIYDLYDESGKDDADNPFGVGTIYDSAEINASLQSGGAPLTNDIFGHGTATTGIIAGNGSGADPEENFRGVAFESTIISIIVTRDYVPPFGANPGQSGAYNPEILTYGFQFAEQKIAELAMPSVTLLNIGSIQDPTDGSVGLCEIIDNYVSAGHTFVCGVGDDGGKENHMIEQIILDQTTEFVIQKGEPGNLRFTGWYDEEDRVELRVMRPNGVIEGPFETPAGPTDFKDNFLEDINIYHRGKDTEFSNSSSDLRMILIDLFGETGTYKIMLTPTQVNSDGKINAFLNPSRFHDTNAFLNIQTSGGNINPFSACQHSISPGDYVVTNSWTDINGIARTINGEGAPGEIWIGSSAGPTMDDRFGIDVVAPGELAWAPYSQDSYYASFSGNVLENSQGFYGIQNAVSAAAPIVTGVIALMLQVNPNLTPLEIKDILQEAATEDAFTGTTPNNNWGYGKLNALSTIDKTYTTVDLENSKFSVHDIELYPNPTREFIEVIYPDYSATKIELSIHMTDGRMLKDTFISSSEKLDIRDLENGVYILRINVDNHTYVKRFIKH